MYNSNLSLKFILEQRQGKGFSETEVINVLQHILPQLEQLHNQGKTQSNISLDSLLFSNNQVLLQINDSNYNQDYSKDIYDLGIVLIELLTAKPVYQMLNLPIGETWDDYCTISDQLLNTINTMIAAPYQRFNSVREILVSLNLSNNPAIISTNGNSYPTVTYSRNPQANKINIVNKPVNKINSRLLTVLTVIVTIGILASIALLSYLKSLERGAKLNMNFMIKSQSSYFQENGKFTNFTTELMTKGLVIVSNDGGQYQYEIKILDQNRVIAIATPKIKGLHGIIGATFISNDQIIDGICMTQKPSQEPPQSPHLINMNFQCPDNYTLISDVNIVAVPEQFIPRPSPEQAIVNYYDILNQQKYQTGWELLAPELRNNFTLHPKGFDSYLEWWTQVAYVNVLNTRLINQTPNNSAVLTDLRYRLQSGRIINQTLEFDFVWDSERKQWLIDRVQRQ